MIYLFDFDGTLVNSEKGIINSFKHTFNEIEYDSIHENELSSFIGPPLQETFEKIFESDKKKAESALLNFRNFYQEKGQYEVELYPLIKSLLENLSKNNTLCVATAKPENIAKSMIKNLNIEKYFDFIGGATFNSDRIDKYDIINYVLDNIDYKNKSEIFMIGDRATDILGAKKANINSIGVLWGFGSKNELENANPNYIVEDIESIYSIKKIKESLI